METASLDVQNERRRLWTDFNSMKTREVPVYVLDPHYVWREVFDEKDLECEDELFRHYENWLRLQIYHASFGDDFITEPWITVKPVYKNEQANWDTWGLPLFKEKISETQAYHYYDAHIYDGSAKALRNDRHWRFGQR